MKNLYEMHRNFENYREKVSGLKFFKKSADRRNFKLIINFFFNLTILHYHQNKSLWNSGMKSQV